MSDEEIAEYLALHALRSTGEPMSEVQMGRYFQLREQVLSSKELEERAEQMGGVFDAFARGIDDAILEEIRRDARPTLRRMKED